MICCPREPMPRSVRSALSVLVLSSTSIITAQAAGSRNPALERDFTQTVKPFFNRYCIGCHSGATPAAQFDLRSYSTVASVLKDFPHWSLLLDRLKAKEMPPKPLPQPPDEARNQIIAWIKALRA